ncbi:hypothetical protein RF11_10038 [Thelohanellus kitauei]|uniref:Uncharacterized protein n=1 Tax=Thelohanellus kitauei TaxID=669202 RepID=A0A0C2IF39_THEKT|nr:hypothetical protein RF11_10038 [Thelohanellus kitauei]
MEALRSGTKLNKLQLNAPICLRTHTRCNDLLRVQLFPVKIAVPFSGQITDINSAPVVSVFNYIKSLRPQERLYVLITLTELKGLYDKLAVHNQQIRLMSLVSAFSNADDPDPIGDIYTLQDPAGVPTILPQTRKPDH